MASTFTTSLRLEQPAPGDYVSGWSPIVNNNITALIDQAVSGRAVVSMSDADYTLTVLNGSSDESRCAVIVLTGALTATRNVVCPSVPKTYIVHNNTTGGQSIVFKTLLGTGVTVPAAARMLVVCDGTNVIDAIDRVAASGSAGQNMVINGDMIVNQRGGSPPSVSTTTPTYCVDLWPGLATGGGVFTLTQVVGTPVAGRHASFLRATVTTQDSSLAAGDYYIFRQRIEGTIAGRLNFGTANAQPVTIQFLVRSSVAGTYPVYVANGANNRSYVATFTINATNTWEQKSITIPGDTTGTWVSDETGAGLELGFVLGAGSTYNTPAGSWVGSLKYNTTTTTNLISTLSATFDVTGVQAELGSTANQYQYVDPAQTLYRCYRYYYTRTVWGFAWPQNIGSAPAARNFSAPYPVIMRAVPTLSLDASFILTTGSFSITRNGRDGFAAQGVGNGGADTLWYVNSYTADAQL